MKIKNGKKYADRYSKFKGIAQDENIGIKLNENPETKALDVSNDLKQSLAVYIKNPVLVDKVLADARLGDNMKEALSSNFDVTVEPKLIALRNSKGLSVDKLVRILVQTAREILSSTANLQIEEGINKLTGVFGSQIEKIEKETADIKSLNVIDTLIGDNKKRYKKEGININTAHGQSAENIIMSIMALMEIDRCYNNIIIACKSYILKGQVLNPNFEFGDIGKDYYDIFIPDLTQKKLVNCFKKYYEQTLTYDGVLADAMKVTYEDRVELLKEGDTLGAEIETGLKEAGDSVPDPIEDVVDDVVEEDVKEYQPIEEKTDYQLPVISTPPKHPILMQVPDLPDFKELKDKPITTSESDQLNLTSDEINNLNNYYSKGRPKFINLNTSIQKMTSDEEIIYHVLQLNRLSPSTSTIILNMSRRQTPEIFTDVGASESLLRNRLLSIKIVKAIDAQKVNKNKKKEKVVVTCLPANIAGAIVNTFRMLKKEIQDIQAYFKQRDELDNLQERYTAEYEDALLVYKARKAKYDLEQGKLGNTPKKAVDLVPEDDGNDVEYDDMDYDEDLIYGNGLRRKLRQMKKSSLTQIKTKVKPRLSEHHLKLYQDKYYIDLKKLDLGILEIRYTNNKHLTIKPIMISDKLRAIIIELMHEKDITSKAVQDLSSKEQHLLKTVSFYFGKNYYKPDLTVESLID